MALLNEEWMKWQHEKMRASRTRLGVVYSSCLRASVDNPALLSAMDAICEANAALNVIALDERIRKFLIENDPKALQQVLAALE